MNGYPERRHLRLIPWQQMLEWGVAHDQMPMGHGPEQPGGPSFVYGAAERHLRQELGEKLWAMDSQGPAGIVIKADPGYRFGEGLEIIQDLDDAEGEPEDLQDDGGMKVLQDWKNFKDREGLLDFTDLIEIYHRDVPEAPGAPQIMLVDEAQDLEGNGAG